MIVTIQPNSLIIENHMASFWQTCLLGFGLLFVAGRTAEEVAQGLFVLGVLSVALGVGFVVSAIVAYGISRRLGLLDRPVVQDHA